MDANSSDEEEKKEEESKEKELGEIKEVENEDEDAEGKAEEGKEKDQNEAILGEPKNLMQKLKASSSSLNLNDIEKEAIEEGYYFCTTC